MLRTIKSVECNRSRDDCTSSNSFQVVQPNLPVGIAGLAGRGGVAGVSGLAGIGGLTGEGGIGDAVPVLVTPARKATAI